MTLHDQPVSAPSARGQNASPKATPAHFAHLIDELSAPIALWDREMRNSYANAAYALWFGRTPEQLHGVHLRDLLDDRAYQRNLPSLRRVLSGLPETYESRLRDALGAVRDVQVTLTPLIIDAEVTGFSVLFVDLSARVYAEAELRTQQAQAAVLRERRRIEGQLHEAALQELYAAALALSVAVKAAPTEIEPRIATAISSIDHAIADVRATVRGDLDIKSGRAS